MLGQCSVVSKCSLQWVATAVLKDRFTLGCDLENKMTFLKVKMWSLTTQQEPYILISYVFPVLSSLVFFPRWEWFKYEIVFSHPPFPENWHFLEKLGLFLNPRQSPLTDLKFVQNYPTIFLFEGWIFDGEERSTWLYTVWKKRHRATVGLDSICLCMEGGFGAFQSSWCCGW